MSTIIKLRNIKQALRLAPDEIKCYSLSGRIVNFRDFKAFNFIDLTDGSTREKMQVVIKKDLLKKPNLGAFLIVNGNIVESRGPGQPLEFKVKELDYLGDCDPSTYPLTSLMSMRGVPDGLTRPQTHLRSRFQEFASILRVRSELELGLNMIMKQMDFFKVHTPSITSNDSESSADLFKVQRTKLLGNARTIKDDYFGSESYLTTSAQLHLESLAAGLSRVYSWTTAFRAENSQTRRHLSEFNMFEAEESGVRSVDALMDRVESVIKFTAQFLTEVSNHKSDLDSLIKSNEYEDTFMKVAFEPYIRMDYSEALNILRDKTDFVGDTSFGSDIGRDQERKLLNYSGGVPIFITYYPKTLKPFYMKTKQENPEVVECFDLIAPVGGEICGGSLREDSFEVLGDNLRQKSIDSKNFDWYMDLRRFGTFPHGGFGVGIERLVQSLSGTKNIRDTSAFPRWAGHCPM